jgi:hypothetical protein
MSSCIDLTGQEARSDKGQHPPAVEANRRLPFSLNTAVSPALTVHGDKNQEQGRIFAVRSTAGTPIESPTT